MHLTAEALNNAAKEGVIIEKLNAKSLIAAFNQYRDRGEYVSGKTEMILCVKDSDYDQFLCDPDVDNWIEYTRNKQLHLLGLDGSIQGITIFTDAFLPKHLKVLKNNVLFKLPSVH